MSVINRYGPVVQQYGSPEQLAQQDPRLLNQIITELGQSGEAQDQAAYEQLKEYYSPSVGGGAFIVHQDMKDAMTRQQQAYAQPIQPQPTGNPVYNAAVAAAKKSEPVITQAAVPDASTGEPKVIVMKPSSYWDTGAVTPESPMTMGKPEVIRESGVKLEPPTGYQIVPGSIKTTDSNIEYQVQPTSNVPAGLTPEKIVAAQPSKGFAEDFASGISQVLGGQRQSLPSLGVSSSQFMTPSEKSAVKTVGLATVTVLTVPAAPIVGLTAKGVVAGQALGVGINQAVKSFQGGGLLTLEEAFQASAEGGVFMLASGGIMKGIGTAGKALNIGLPSSVAGRVAAASGRIGVNTALGAGAGYVLSGGDVEGAKTGALFGAAFGVAGEVAVVAAPKIQARMRQSVPGQKAQEYLNRYYEVDAVTGKRAVNIGAGEKVMQKTLGIKPQKPSLQVLEQSTIPTAPKDAFETVKVTELKAKQELKSPANLKGEVERLTINEPKITEKTYLVEKTTPESIRLTSKMQGNLQVADDLTMIVKGKELISPNTILKGESVKPSEFYATGKPKEPIIGDPKLSFNKQAGPVTEFEAYSFKQSTKVAVPAKPSELSFSKVTYDFDELQQAVKSGKVKGAVVGGDDVAVVSKAFQVEKSYGDYPWKGIDAQNALSQGALVQAGKSLTKGVAAAPTGIDKVVGDIQAGRVVDTSKAVQSVAPSSPFAFAGRSYYGEKKTVSVDVETQYLTMPGEVQRLGESGVAGVSGVPSFMPQTSGGVAGFDLKPEPVVQPEPPKSEPTFTPSIVPVVVPDVTPSYMPRTDDIEIPIESIIEIPRPDEPIKPIDDTPQKPVYEPPPPIIDVGISGLGFPSGFKFEGGGYSLPSHSRSVGMRSTLKVHPILTGLEALTGGRKREKRVSKTKKTKKR